MDFFISGGEGGIIPAITKYYWLTLNIINQIGERKISENRKLVINVKLR